MSLRLNFFHLCTRVITEGSDLDMASSDVDSLFTNIPSDETIDICVNKLFQNPENLVNKISKNYFRDLLKKSFTKQVLNSGG